MLNVCHIFFIEQYNRTMLNLKFYFMVDLFQLNDTVSVVGHRRHASDSD